MGDECQLGAEHWLDPHTTPVSSGHPHIKPCHYVCQPQFESKPILDQGHCSLPCITVPSHVCRIYRDFMLKNTLPQKAITLTVGCLSTFGQDSLVEGVNTVFPEGWSSPRG